MLNCVCFVIYGLVFCCWFVLWIDFEGVGLLGDVWIFCKVMFGMFFGVGLSFVLGRLNSFVVLGFIMGR